MCKMPTLTPTNVKSFSLLDTVQPKHDALLPPRILAHIKHLSASLPTPPLRVCACRCMRVHDVATSECACIPSRVPAPPTFRVRTPFFGLIGTGVGAEAGASPVRTITHMRRSSHSLLDTSQPKHGALLPPRILAHIKHSSASLTSQHVCVRVFMLLLLLVRAPVLVFMFTCNCGHASMHFHHACNVKGKEAEDQNTGLKGYP